MCNYTKFGLAFIHELILLLGSFLLLARCSAICEKKRLHSLLTPPKYENTSGVNDPCFTWRIWWLYSRFFSISFFIWTAIRLWCKWHLANGLKTLTSQEAVCPLIHNPLASITLFVVSQEFSYSSWQISVGMIHPIPPYFPGNEKRTRSVGLKAYPYNDSLMKVSL